MVLPTSSFFSSGNRSNNASHRNSVTNRTSPDAANANGKSPSNASRASPNVDPSNLPRGALRSRESVVVSSQEIRQLFDGLKDVSNLVRRQSKKIEEMASDVDVLKVEVVELKNHVHQLTQTVDKEKESQIHYGPIPKEVKDAVRLLHSQQDDNNQFNGNEGIESTHNARVRGFLLNELLKEDIGHPRSTIQRGISKHYETKRQAFLDSLPERQESTERKNHDKKLASRRRRLYVNRTKVCTEAETQQWGELTPIMMSDEEDGEGDNRGAWIVRSPTWRSGILNTLVCRLQSRVDEREASSSSKHPKNHRINGPSTEREPPSSCPAWALKSRQVQISPTPAAENEDGYEEQTPARKSAYQQNKTNKSQRSLGKKLRALAKGRADTLTSQPAKRSRVKNIEDDDDASF